MNKSKPSSPEFKRYEKIAESPSQWKLDESGHRQLQKMEWVVTEKIHGAHFCILADERNVHAAKRKQTLEPQEDFFGYSSIREELFEKVRELFEALKKQHPKLISIILHGELFGGAYPHPDLPEQNEFQAIQTGVYYSPNIHFCGYDIALFEKEERSSSKTSKDRYFLDYNELIKQLKQVGLLYAEPLFTGSFEKALAYPSEFASTWPEKLGLPTLPDDNQAEGIVIKPINALEIETSKGKIRPILKIKHKRFSEDPRFHQAQKWQKQNWKKNTHTQQPESLLKHSELEKTAIALINQTRVDSAISKIGIVKRKDKKKVRQLSSLLYQDAWEHLEEYYLASLSTLTNKQEKHLRQQLRTQSKDLVKKYLA